MPIFNVEFDVSGLKKGTQEATTSISGMTQQVDKATKSIDLWQDSAGRWRNASGQFASAAEKASAGIKEASENMSSFGKSASDTTNKIKILAAQIVGLVGVYKTLEGVMSFVKRGMDFNASLESSEIAIASIISATNKISTSEGKALEGVEKFNAAQELSKGIMDEIQVLALQTTATFDSLADGVAGIIAPATKAGVSLEKMPKFAVTAAQAMTTMRIPIQQMRTEIESLLSGNINGSQDLLAANLGITGKMVRNWQQQGTLVEELEKRLYAFAIAGDKVANSWSGLTGNMEDALNFLSGKSGKGIFEGAKKSYQELLTLMVNTEGKVGVGKDLENIMQLITDIQNAIGDELLTVTRDFIEYIKELNKPENLKEFKGKLEDIYKTAQTAFDAVSKAGSLLVDITGSVISGWQNLPEPIREYGLFMAILGGKKMKLAFAAISYLGQFKNELGAVLSAVQNTKLTDIDNIFENYTVALASQTGDKSVFKNKEEDLKAQIDTIKKEIEDLNRTEDDSWGDKLRKANELKKTLGDTESALRKIQNLGNGETGGEVNVLLRDVHEPKKEEGKATPNQGKKYGTGSAIGSFTSDKKGKTEAEKFAEKSERYQVNIEKFRNEVKALEQALDPSLTKMERMKAQIEAERDATIKNADVKANETVRRKEATEAQAKDYAELEKRKAILTANQKLEELNNQNLQEKATFYSQLAEATGEYNTSSEYQNQILEKQKKIWESLGIPISDINKMLEVQRLNLSRDGWDGITRGMKKYYAEATDYATAYENVWTSGLDGMADALTTFAMTGKLSFKDLANSIIQDIIRIQMRAAVSGLFNMVVGAFSGGIAPSGRGYSGYDAALGQNVSNVPIHHVGGVVGDMGMPTRNVPMSLFAKAPRYHDGTYLRSDERAAILQTGENVLSRVDSGNLGAKLDRIATLLSSQQANLSNGGSTSVVLVDDQRKVKNYLMSVEGQKTFVALLNQNRQSVQNVSQGGRA